MHVVSRDKPSFYLTSVSKDRLPVFRSDEVKMITCSALDEARKSGGFVFYAYVIMIDHLHIIADSARSSARLMARTEEYRWSSVRRWNRKLIENEPLLMDLDRIRWRSR